MTRGVCECVCWGGGAEFIVQVYIPSLPRAAGLNVSSIDLILMNQIKLLIQIIIVDRLRSRTRTVYIACMLVFGF